MQAFVSGVDHLFSLLFLYMAPPHSDICLENDKSTLLYLITHLPRIRYNISLLVSK